MLLKVSEVDSFSSFKLGYANVIFYYLQQAIHFLLCQCIPYLKHVWQHTLYKDFFLKCEQWLGDALVPVWCLLQWVCLPHAPDVLWVNLPERC